MSHHIEHIEISNFKSIRHATIEGCKRINVFIGYPNVGKSAILEAMSMLSYNQADNMMPISEICRMENPSELFFNGDTNKQIEISHSKDISFVLRSTYRDQLDLFIRAKKKYEYSEDDTKFSFDEKQFLKYLIFYEGGIVENNSEKSNEEYPSRKFVSSNISVKKYDYKKLSISDKGISRSLNFPHGDNLVDILQSHTELRKEISQMFRAYNLNLSIDQGNNSLKALKRLDDETIYLIPFHQMADTLQRLIFHKAAIMSNQNSVLLFEEPEAHMFPPYIRKFTKDIVFDKERNNQFFIATHSPLVVSDFLEDAREDLAIHLVGLKNGETTIKTLTEAEVTEVYEYGVDLFFNIESYLE